MKFLISAVVLFACANVFAGNQAPAHKTKIQIVKSGAALSLAPSLEFFGPGAVGRISPTAYLVEIVGLVVPDMWPPYPAPPKLRMLKAVLDISPVSNSPADIAAADELLSYFYSVKTGKDDDGVAIAKVVSIAYQLADIVKPLPANSVCLGIDLDIPVYVTAPLIKTCYTVRPSHIIQH